MVPVLLLGAPLSCWGPQQGAHVTASHVPRSVLGDQLRDGEMDRAVKRPITRVVSGTGRGGNEPFLPGQVVALLQSAAFILGRRLQPVLACAHTHRNPADQPARGLSKAHQGVCKRW